MPAALAMFAARFGSFYPASYSPSKIDTLKKWGNLQAPAAGVVFRYGKTTTNPSERHRYVGVAGQERFTTAGGSRPYQHTNPGQAEKSFQR